MCVKLPKPLNPEAEEWRPTPAPPPPLPLLPHALIRPAPPPPPQLVVALTAAAQLKLQHQSPEQYTLSYLPPPRYSLFTHYTQPVYTISFPSDQYLHKETDAATPPICEESCERGMESDDAKSQKCPNKKSPKMFLPPRLRRALKSQTEPPPPKLEWRLKNALDTGSKVPGDGGAASSPSKTTLMIKNIPNQLRRDFMLKFLDGYCKTHSLEYDFLYLPIDFRRLGNLGYAFVNFTTAAAAMKMKKILCNYKWRATYKDEGEFVFSNKVCELKWARIQGKEALVRRFEKVSFNCDDEEFLPVILDPPRNGSDPNPPAPVNLGRLAGPAH